MNKEQLCYACHMRRDIFWEALKLEHYYWFLEKDHAGLIQNVSIICLDDIFKTFSS